MAKPFRDENGIDTFDNSNYRAPIHVIIGMAGFALDGFSNIVSSYLLLIFYNLYHSWWPYLIYRSKVGSNWGKETNNPYPYSLFDFYNLYHYFYNYILAVNTNQINYVFPNKYYIEESNSLTPWEEIFSTVPLM